MLTTNRYAARVHGNVFVYGMVVHAAAAPPQAAMPGVTSLPGLDGD